MTLNMNELAWEKMQNLLPAIVQDANNKAVLMLGYMNKEALQHTIESKQVTFYSRSTHKLWTKGETSGNKLQLIDISMDCDQDALLITAIPLGPTCHTGSTTCFGHSEISDENFLSTLEAIIAARQQSASDSSYTVKLFAAGMSRMAQKVGEEGVEVALAAMEKNPEKLCNEAADLLFHVLVLLRANNLSLADVNKVLQKRNQKK